MTFKTLCTAFTLLMLPTLCLAEINQVRVLNSTNSTMYIHKGGYAQSIKLLAHKWKILPFPFKVVPPNSTKPITTSLLVVTSGGRWTTTPNGLTHLANPSMVICIDYRSPEHKNKTGNRLWSIQHATGQDPSCEVKPYKQPWATDKDLS